MASQYHLNLLHAIHLPHMSDGTHVITELLWRQLIAILCTLLMPAWQVCSINAEMNDACIVIAGAEPMQASPAVDATRQQPEASASGTPSAQDNFRDAPSIALCIQAVQSSCLLPFLDRQLENASFNDMASRYASSTSGRPQLQKCFPLCPCDKHNFNCFSFNRITYQSPCLSVCKLQPSLKFLLSCLTFLADGYCCKALNGQIAHPEAPCCSTIVAN